MPPPRHFVALVTGASSGIGEATARRLAREEGVQLILVARREERLRALAMQLGGATVVALDLTGADAPTALSEIVQREHGQLHLLVNNAGAAWHGEFAETGWASLERHMKLNFGAPARLTEALLPVLRQTAAGLLSQPAARGPGSEAGAGPGDEIGGQPWNEIRGRAESEIKGRAESEIEAASARVSIVNVASTSARVSRPGSGAYGASKSALAGWSDALHLEERRHGVHVGLVLPGFVETEGFPAAGLRARRATRWMVSSPELVAEAIVQAGPGGKAERYVPRPYWLAGAARTLAPALVRRIAGAFTTTSTAEP